MFSTLIFLLFFHFGKLLWFSKVLSFHFISFRVINFHGKEHKFASINESVMWLWLFKKKTNFIRKWEKSPNVDISSAIQSISRGFYATFMTSFSCYRLDYLVYCYIKLKHCILYFTGVDTEFLVQLRLHHWYNIYIGYRCTATNWISGTRSYGECLPEYNTPFTYEFDGKTVQCSECYSRKDKYSRLKCIWSFRN